MLGSFTSSAGSLLTLLGSTGLKPETLSKFAPTFLELLQSRAGGDLVSAPRALRSCPGQPVQIALPKERDMRRAILGFILSSWFPYPLQPPPSRPWSAAG